ERLAVGVGEVLLNKKLEFFHPAWRFLNADNVGIDRTDYPRGSSGRCVGVIDVGAIPILKRGLERFRSRSLNEPVVHPLDIEAADSNFRHTILPSRAICAGDNPVIVRSAEIKFSLLKPV